MKDENGQNFTENNQIELLFGILRSSFEKVGF